MELHKIRKITVFFNYITEYVFFSKIIKGEISNEKINSSNNSQMINENECKMYQEQIVSAQTEKEKLENIKNSIGSTEYLKNVATEKLDRFLPNEKIYINTTN